MTAYEISPYASRGLGARYYRLALAAAAARNLSGAVLYAWYACELDHEHRDAVKLLRLCRYELGEPGDTADFAEPGISDKMEQGLERIRHLGVGKKWREAAQAARGLPHQSVRVLNIQGCLWALAKDPVKGADCFARALRKDRFNRLAGDGLAELAGKRKRFWNILERIFYEKPV
jgi:hypothetical protein